MRKLLVLAVFLLLSCPLAFADFGDEATIGGQNADGEYRWRVQSDGDLTPGEDSAVDIGETGHEVQTIYADDLSLTDDLTVSGDATVTGTVTSVAYRLSTSEKVAIIDPDVDTMAAGDTTISYDYGIWSKTASGDETLTLTNGTAGDMIVIQYARGNGGNVTVVANTQTGWSTGYLNSVGDSITFQYIDDTVGWIVIGSAGQNQSVVNSLLDDNGN